MAKPPSAFVPLDVNYLRDRDIRRAGPDAELLFLRGLTYCKGSFNDGHIPEYDLPLVAVGLKNVDSRIQKLVEVGLWQEEEGGWYVRGWSLWNETSSETKEKRDRAAKRQADRRARVKEAVSPDSHSDVTRDKGVTAPVTSLASHSTKEEEEEESIDATRDAPRDNTSTRRRDELWDAIVEVCGLDSSSLTKTAASNVGKVRRELAEVGATPAEVRRRAGRYRERFRNADLTVNALVNHWAGLGERQAPPAPPRPQDVMAALSPRAPRAGGAS